MGIIKEFFDSRKKKRETVEEQRFNALTLGQKREILGKILQLDERGVENVITKKPYILPHIIADLEVSNLLKLVDIATKKGVSVYDLLDKTGNLSNTLIINTAVKNQPELVLELDDMPQWQDLITTETLIEAFKKNPEVIFSSCKALEAKIKISGTKRDGKEGTRYSTLKAQLQRAMNIYFRPESYKGNGFDNFAKSIADGIDGAEFMKKVYGNKMTTRSTTAANETLKQNPEKASVVPAKTLHNWNNRVLYTVPNVARKEAKKSSRKYYEYKNYLLGLLQNPSLNSFSIAEKTRLVKKCVSIVPEIFFELDKINGYENVKDKLTVQLTAYEAFKTEEREAEAKRLLAEIGVESEKKLLSRSKANVTRKANKKKKVKAPKVEQKTKTDGETL